MSFDLAIHATVEREIAVSLVLARKKATALPGFPGKPPRTLDEAYAIQFQAIALWPDRIAGWKVGRLTPALADRYGVDRFIGPIFAGTIETARHGHEQDFPACFGGSAAFEAEFIVRVAQDQPTGSTTFDSRIARSLIDRMHIGVEVAGSPVAVMRDLDSLASIAGFGNNNGLILGPRVPMELLDNPAQMSCSTRIDGHDVGQASAADLPGGPVAAVAFALSQAVKLGLPMKAGQYISTGAVTGMHWVGVGQRCSADFGPWGRIDCLVVPVGRA